MSTAKKKTIKFAALMTVLILTVSYFSLLTPTSAYFYKEIDKDGTITFSLLQVNNGQRIFDEKATLKFKGATKFADYGEKLFDEVAVVKEFTVINTGVDAKILPRITLHGDSAKNGLKYMIIMSDPVAVSEETSDSESVEEETITKGELKEEIESHLNLFPETTTQEGATTQEPSIEYSDAVSKLDAYNEYNDFDETKENKERKSVVLKTGESVDVKIIFWAEYTDIVKEKGESAWQDAGKVETIPYQCTIEIIASQWLDNNESENNESNNNAAVTEALKEVPTWETTSATDNQ